MKQIALLHYLLLFTFLSILPITYEKIITQQETSSLPSLQSLLPKHPQEGFYADTLIPTPIGYKKIKNITQGDIVIDAEGRYKKVIATTRTFVDKYIKLIVADTGLYTGCDQIYYTYPDYHQVHAKDIKIGDIFLPAGRSIL